MNTTIPKRVKCISIFIMAFLSLYPILYAYMNSFSFNYGEMLFLGLLPLILILAKSYRITTLPSGYYVFWFYVALLLIISSGDFKVTYLIPGGIAFTIFSLMTGVSIKYFNIDYLYKLMRSFLIIASLIFILQYMGLTPEEYSRCFILPISDHLAYSNLDYEGLIAMRQYGTRACSIFLEPAYFAQYACIFLVLELFYKAGTERLYTKLSIFIVAILLLSRSGCALLGLATVAAVKLITYLRYTKRSMGYLLFVLPIIGMSIFYYFSTDVGVALLDRTAELNTEGSSGYMRVFQGFFIYDYLPLINKIFGISTEDLMNMNIPFLSVGRDGEVAMFTNGLFTLLIRTGFVGFIIFMYIYIKMYKSTNIVGKASLWLLLSLSLVEQVYLLFPMMLCTVLTTKEFNNTIQR